ncbi:MAG: EFR1 family ferrodoxin [Ignavibacteria bacterium]|nr:EFR1 family ferrodoxin [Ignavibacteria bacterium]
MIQFKNIDIYYFSGTGNSKNCAIWFQRSAQEAGTECRIHDITRLEHTKITAPDMNTLVVFISPVHGFNYPPIMLNFITRFPRGSSPVVLMNTRAGMLIKNWITPGLSGITFYLSAFILALKGYSFRSFYPVNLPSNWISVHPGLNERTVKYLHQKNMEQVEGFASAILSGARNFRSCFELIQDAIIAPIAVLYYFIGRFFLAKTYYASADCDNCGLCSKNCPVQAIHTIRNRPYWTIHCESCMKCLGNCPQKAIETAHGFVGIIIVIYNLVLLSLMYKYVYPVSPIIDNALIRFLIEPVILIAFTSAAYFIAHITLGFRFFERLMVFTSLTKYKFWGRRYKALKQYGNKS